MTDRLIDDPAWVLSMYQEAKELLDCVRSEVSYGAARLRSEIVQDLDAFYEATLMDHCTTLGPGCGCSAADEADVALSGVDLSVGAATTSYPAAAEARRAEAPPRPRPLPDPEGGQMYG